MTPLSFNDAWTGEDKKAHCAAGAALAAVMFAPAMLLGAKSSLALVIGLLVCTAVAWGKELWDARHPPHHPSAQDAIVTMAGGLVSAAAAAALLLATGQA